MAGKSTSSSAPLVMFLSRFQVSLRRSAGSSPLALAAGFPKKQPLRRTKELDDKNAARCAATTNQHVPSPETGRSPPMDGAFAVRLSRFQHQGKPVLRIPNDHNLGIRARRQLLRSLDALPFEQLRADARGHNLLEVCNTLRFDALALRLLLFLLQDEAHPQGILLGLLLGLDGAFQHRRQL